MIEIVKKALDLCVVQYKLISAVLLLLITALSLSPVEQLPVVPGSDKTHHIIAYALLMLPTGIARPKHWPYMVLFFVAWSGAIELLQPFVNRYGEWLDLLANSFGLLCGYSVGRLLGRLLRLDVEHPWH